MVFVGLQKGRSRVVIVSLGVACRPCHLTCGRMKG